MVSEAFGGQSLGKKTQIVEVGDQASKVPFPKTQPKQDASESKPNGLRPAGGREIFGNVWAAGFDDLLDSSKTKP
jgi:hypothetical protein